MTEYSIIPPATPAWCLIVDADDNADAGDYPTIDMQPVVGWRVEEGGYPMPIIQDMTLLVEREHDHIAIMHHDGTVTCDAAALPVGAWGNRSWPNYDAFASECIARHWLNKHATDDQKAKLWNKKPLTQEDLDDIFARAAAHAKATGAEHWVDAFKRGVLTEDRPHREALIDDEIAGLTARFNAVNNIAGTIEEDDPLGE